MATNGGSTSERGAVRVEALSKHFGAVRAVDGVTLDVRPSEFLALLGPSGSGKTTILMAIAGFEFPNAGRILVGGEDVTYRAPNKRNLGMVFQRTTLFPHMSVQENVAFPLKVRGVDRAARAARAEAALERVRLGGYGGRRASQLSGGQQQRVAIARAIVYEPGVMLMDEPLSALDKNLREEMQLEIRRLQHSLGMTVIFVTHDQTEALTMADRVAVIDHGKLQQVGSPKDLYERPETAFVAGFIGETNFLEAETLAAGAAESPTPVRLPCGAALVGQAVRPIAAGAPARLAVRPERVRLAEPAGEGELAGVVVEAIYVGVATTLVVDIGRERRLRVRLAAGAPSFPVGATVGASFRPEDARLYGAAGAAS